jgi:hypothetical protein
MGGKMRTITLLAVISTMLIAAQAQAAKPLHPLKLTIGCLWAPLGGPADYFSVLVTGKDTHNDEIEWSPSPTFNPSYHGALEGTDAALGLWTDRTVGPYYQGPYPNGVWIRWANGDHKALHASVPAPCQAQPGGET